MEAHDPERRPWRLWVGYACIGLVGIIIIVLVPKTVFAVPITLLPLGLVYVVVIRGLRHKDDVVLARLFDYRVFQRGVVAATLGIFGSIVVETLIAVALAFITIPSEIRAAFGKEFKESWKQSPSSPTETVSGTDHDLFKDTSTIVFLFVFFFLLSFVGAALVEEVAKLLSAYVDFCDPCCRRATQGTAELEWEDNESRKDPQILLASFVAAGAGFAAMETLLYSISAAVEHSEGLVTATWTAAARGMVSFPIHILCAVLTAAGVMKRLSLDGSKDRPGWVRVLYPAVLLHGSFNFMEITMAVVLQRFGPFRGSKNEKLWINLILMGVGLAVAIIGGWIATAKMGRYVERIRQFRAAQKGRGAAIAAAQPAGEGARGDNQMRDLRSRAGK